MVGNCLRSVSHSNGVRAAASEIGRKFELDQVPVIRFRYPILHMPVLVPHTGPTQAGLLGEHLSTAQSQNCLSFAPDCASIHERVNVDIAMQRQENKNHMLLIAPDRWQIIVIVCFMAYGHC